MDPSPSSLARGTTEVLSGATSWELCSGGAAVVGAFYSGDDGEVCAFDASGEGGGGGGVGLRANYGIT